MRKITSKRIRKDNSKVKQGHENDLIPNSLEEIKQKLQTTFSECSDFTMHEFFLGEEQEKIIIAFIEDFVEKRVMDQDIIEPLLQIKEISTKQSRIKFLKEKVVCSARITEISTFTQTVDYILTGGVAIFLDNENIALCLIARINQGRSIEEPTGEISMRGPREGFVENININRILLRKKIKNTNFKTEAMQIGTITKTDVTICYVKGLANDEILAEVKKRLTSIEIDSVLDSSYIEKYIEDDYMPLFPLVGNSEKPDKVAAKLLEGRIAIICDGSPIVLTVPYLFLEAFQASEDYGNTPFFASFVRILRFVAFFISIYLPALYVALVSFHQNVIPFKLLLTMAASREGVPFSSFSEALIMTITFEFLREAGIRLPRSLGQAISIVGAIILGDAAVRAGIASPPLIIVVALTAICSFIAPPLLKVGTFFRIVNLFFANFMGLFGIDFVTVVSLIYVIQKASFGVPYLAPFAPMNPDGLKDSMLEVPIWAMKTFPENITGTKRSRRREKKKW